MGITASLRFGLALYENRPIHHRQSTDIPPTVNGQRMAESRPLYRPIVGQYVDRHAADTAADISADMSTDISRSIYRPSVGRYVDRHIGRVSVDISADTSIHQFFLVDTLIQTITLYKQLILLGLLLGLNHLQCYFMLKGESF